MALELTGTIVTYPSGATSSSGVVVHSEKVGDLVAVVLDVTACHPVDAAWPDQGADRGVIAVGGREYPIVDCVVGATDGTQLFLGGDIPVRKGTEGWTFVVVHLVTAAAPLTDGDAATVTVDADYRKALSIGHTACHLASLALNAELAGAWSKDAPADAYGNPNFDALAIETSTIGENGSLDVYRLGKSLRKKGFAPAALTDDTGAVAAGITARLTGWAASGGVIAIRTEGETLTDRRYWECELDGVAISIACGGTHATDLSAVSGIRATLERTDAGSAVEVRMTTTV